MAAPAERERLELGCCDLRRDAEFREGRAKSLQLAGGGKDVFEQIRQIRDGYQLVLDRYRAICADGLNKRYVVGRSFAP